MTQPEADLYAGVSGMEGVGRGAASPDLTDTLLEAALADMEDNKKWAKKRRSRAFQRLSDMEIVAFVGKNGHGKSAAAVAAMMGTLRGIRWKCDEPSHLHNDPVLDDDGNAIACGPNAKSEGWRYVYSTVEITTPAGDPHPLYRRLTEWHQVRDAEHCELFLDEVTGIANSRDAMSLPRPVQAKLDKLRKADVRLLLTAPSFQRMDTTLRTIATALVLCRGYLKEPRAKDSVAVTAWRRLRMFRCRVFDPNEFEEFHLQSASTNPKKKNRLRAQFVFWWWGPGSEVFRSYSSKGSVARLGAASDAGLCLDCNGKRSIPSCSCDDQPSRRGNRRQALPDPTF